MEKGAFGSPWQDYQIYFTFMVGSITLSDMLLNYVLNIQGDKNAQIGKDERNTFRKHNLSNRNGK